MGIGVVDVPVPTTENTMALLARRCGPLSPSLAPPAGCGAARTVFDVLTGTPGVPTGVTVSASLQGVRVNWTKGSPADRTLRRFLITASGSVHTGALQGDLDVTETYSIAPALRTSVLPLEAGDWRISVRECTDRGCGVAAQLIDRVRTQSCSLSTTQNHLVIWIVGGGRTAMFLAAFGSGPRSTSTTAADLSSSARLTVGSCDKVTPQERITITVCSAGLGQEQAQHTPSEQVDYHCEHVGSWSSRPSALSSGRTEESWSVEPETQ